MRLCSNIPLHTQSARHGPQAANPHLTASAHLSQPVISRLPRACRDGDAEAADASAVAAADWQPLPRARARAAATALHLAPDGGALLALTAAGATVCYRADLASAARPPLVAVQTDAARFAVHDASGAATRAICGTRASGVALTASDVVLWNDATLSIHPLPPPGGIASGPPAATLAHDAAAAGPLAVVAHGDRVFRLAGGSIEVISAAEGTVSASVAVPAAVGPPRALCVAAAAATLAVVTATWHVRRYSAKGRTLRELSTSQVRIYGLRPLRAGARRARWVAPFASGKVHYARFAEAW